MRLVPANYFEYFQDDILMSSSDLDKINIEKYTYQNVNITGYRIVDPDTEPVRKYLKKSPHRFLQGKSNPLFSSNALMYDAVHVLAKALNNLDSLQTLHLTPLRY